jgi:hypothetical protein
MPSEAQASFNTLSRGRRSKLAAAAKTTLVKAHQWARGELVAKDVAAALEAALKAHASKKK